MPGLIDELVSHLLSLRKDYVQGLLKQEGIPFSGKSKVQLREQIAEALADGRLSSEKVVAFLDANEPGGKQHVFMLRTSRALADQWSESEGILEELRSKPESRDLLDAPLPLALPGDLHLSSIKVRAESVEIVGVESRSYFERDASYDQVSATQDGLKLELRAHVLRTARSLAILRWDLESRRAALHIAQASQRGLEPNYYRNFARRFGEAMSSFLDLREFEDEDLRRVLHQLHQREETNDPFTRSRRGKWETVDGSEMEVVSSSLGASVFEDSTITAAVEQVANNQSGRDGSLYWLPRDGTPFDDPLHISIVASDSRIHFLRPSSPEAVDHVIGQIRTLL